MKKSIIPIVLFVVLAFLGTGFSQVAHQTQNQEQSQDQSQTQSSFNTNSNSQEQSTNNQQTISPSQDTRIDINVEGPKKVVVGSAPNVIAPSELNFISAGERDVTTIMPKFGCDTVKPLTKNDCIVDVLWIDSDIKFKNLYKSVLKGLRSEEVLKTQTKYVRYQIREADSVKSWTTGGSIGANGVGTIGTTITGVAGGILPQIGRSKSSNLYTVIFVFIQAK